MISLARNQTSSRQFKTRKILQTVEVKACEFCANLTPDISQPYKFILEICSACPGQISSLYSWIFLCRTVILKTTAPTPSIIFEGRRKDIKQFS